MTQRLRKTLLLIAAVLLFVCAACFGAIVHADASTESPLSISSEGDKIERFETAYAQDESFVYTARVRFVSGQAAGIAFGIQDDGSGFVLNVDRQANRTKLMYFTASGDGTLSAKVLYEDYYIGNANCSEAELARVQSRVAAKQEFYLKVAVTGGSDPAVRCYVDDILRFDYDAAISLIDEENEITYTGGAIGVNTFAAEAEFGEIYHGASDFTRYTELYRNQYHYSPFSGWNNDPNGLVYDGEYYHLYYQTQPFQKTWGDMYWGHARSKDLVTWENLPIALLPADGSFMWSGSALIDDENQSGLFDSLYESDPSYDGSKNIIIYYTVDGGPDQDQWMAYSLDGGISFIKHKMIIDGASVENGITFRDPKVFEAEEGVWGIIIGGGQLRFYVSTNLTDWTLAGEFPVYAECPDIYKLSVGDGERWVINAGGIGYIVGDLTYDAQTRQFTFTDQFGVELTASETQPSQVKIFDLDNANGSYATQTFYIDNANSAYDGQIIGMSWFAGQPGYQAPMDEHEWLSGEQAVGPDTGAQANIRSIWNGGFTFPVQYSLIEKDGIYLLRQTPIALPETLLQTVYSAQEKTVSSSDENILADVSGNTLKITATIRTDAQRFGFRVFVGDGEYTEFGFDAQEGYYLDRTHTSSGGTIIANYSDVYATGINDYVSADGEYDFVVLLDRGSLEMFCEDATQVFYANTFAGYYSDGLEFFIEGDAAATLSIQIEKIGSAFAAASEEAKLSLSAEEVGLDTVIMTQAQINAYVSGTDGRVEWQIADDSIATLSPTKNGATLTALKNGQTTVTATLYDKEGNVLDEKQVTVQVVQGNADASNLTFSADGIQAGEWHSSAEGISGSRSGDGFILAAEELENFSYEATVSVAGAEAAALVFRSDAQMDFYYVANYDKNQGIVKVWSTEKEFLNVSVGVFDEVTLRIVAEGNTFSYYFNGNLVGTFTDDNAPAKGYVGLNVFNGTAVFGSVKYFPLQSGESIYSGSDVTVYLSTDGYVSKVFNFTLNNSPVDSAYYTQSGNGLTISAKYLKTLAPGSYRFLALTESGTEEFSVTVQNTSLIVSDVILSALADVHVSIGAAALTGVELNGTAIPDTMYSVSNGILTINAEVLAGGLNSVSLVLGDGTRVSFSIIAPERQTPVEPAAAAGWGDILFYVVGSIELVLVVTLLVMVILKRNKCKRMKK